LSSSSHAYSIAGRALLGLSAVGGLLVYGRSLASAADRRRIRKYRALPGRKFRLELSFWGHELRAISIDDSATEIDALELAKFFWFSRGELRPDRGGHAAIIYRDARGRVLTGVGMASRAPQAEYRRTLFVFGDPNLPVKPMKSVPVENIRDLGSSDGKTVI
jgi:hypothetical protein